MSDNIGSIDFKVGIDADKAIAESEVEGEAIGKALNNGIDRGANSKSKSLKNLARDLLGLDDSNKKVTRSTRDLNKENGKSGGFYQSLGTNGKQVIFWGTAIAAASTDIAALGSVAGSSLVVAATSFAALAASAGVAVVAFHNVLGPLSDIDAEARPAAKSIQGLVDSFKDLAGPIQDTVLAGLATPIANITKNLLPSLKAGLLDVSTATNTVLKQLASALSSPAAASTFSKLLTGFGPIIANLGSAAIELSAAFGKIFVAALPSAQKFSGFLETIIGQFNTWLGSDAGQARLEGFFGTLNSVAPHLGDLIGSLGKTLADLVTPETVTNLNHFIDGLTTALPNVGKILGVLGKLDVPGILVDALNELLKAVQPLLGPLGELGTALHGVAEIFIGSLGTLIASLAKALAPVVDAIAEFISSLDPSLVKDFAVALGIFSAAMFIVDAALDANPISLIIIALAALAAGIIFLAEKTTFFQDAWQTTVDIFNNTVGMFVDFFNNTIGMFVDFFNNTVGMFVDWGSSVIGMLTDFFNNTIGMFVDFFTNTVGMFVDFFTNTVGMFVDFWVNVNLAFLNGWNVIVAFFSGIGATIGGWFTTAIAFVVNTWNSIVSTASTVVGRIAAFLGAIGATIGGWFRSAVGLVSTVVSNIIGFFSSVPSKIGGFLGSIGGKIAGFFQDAVKKVGGIVDDIIGFFRDLPGNILKYIAGLGGKIADALGLGNLIPHASGALVMGPQAALIGEAGPEMVVPLARPLSQIDPAVRSVAAFAQGKSVSNTTSTGVGKQVNVQAGAIVVAGVSDPTQAATVVLDDIVRKL